MGAGTNAEGYGSLLFFDGLVEKADVAIYLSARTDERHERGESVDDGLTVSYAVCAMLTFSSAVRIASSDVWAMCWRSVRVVSPSFGWNAREGLADFAPFSLRVALPCVDSVESTCIAFGDVSPP